MASLVKCSRSFGIMRLSHRSIKTIRGVISQWELDSLTVSDQKKDTSSTLPFTACRAYSQSYVSTATKASTKAQIMCSVYKMHLSCLDTQLELSQW